MTEREQIRDDLLVLRCQEGDVQAFEELVGRWQERLWRHAWRLTGDEDAAWDALQEAWMAIGRDIRRLHEPSAFRPWAYRIVSNKCRDWIRRERRRRKTAKDYVEEVLLLAAGDDCSTTRAADVHEALRRLPGGDRSILALRFEEEFDTATIAEILGIPQGTVKSRLHHAKKHLRTIMEEMQNE